MTKLVSASNEEGVEKEICSYVLRLQCFGCPGSALGVISRCKVITEIFPVMGNVQFYFVEVSCHWHYRGKASLSFSWLLCSNSPFVILTLRLNYTDFIPFTNFCVG